MASPAYCAAALVCAAKPVETGQERRILAFLSTSANTLNADICLRRNIRRCGP